VQPFSNESQNDIRFNSAKWNKELERAETADSPDLNMAAMGIASDPHHMLQAQSLSDSEISDLCGLFQVSFFSTSFQQSPNAEMCVQDIALQASEEQRQILHSSIDTLKNPQFSNLVDMTDKVRILGDAPMVTGKSVTEDKMGPRVSPHDPRIYGQFLAGWHVFRESCRG
jgi:hypothetical protein